MFCPAGWCSGQKELAFVVLVYISWYFWVASFPSASSGVDEAKEKEDLGARSSPGRRAPSQPVSFAVPFGLCFVLHVASYVFSFIYWETSPADALNILNQY